MVKSFFLLIKDPATTKHISTILFTSSMHQLKLNMRTQSHIHLLLIWLLLATSQYHYYTTNAQALESGKSLWRISLLCLTSSAVMFHPSCRGCPNRWALTWNSLVTVFYFFKFFIMDISVTNILSKIQIIKQSKKLYMAEQIVPCFLQYLIKTYLYFMVVTVQFKLKPALRSSRPGSGTRYAIHTQVCGSQAVHIFMNIYI